MRRKNQFLQESLSTEICTPSEASTITLDLLDIPAGRTAVIDRVLFTPFTALAVDPSNYVTVQILNAAAIAAAWSTQTTTGNGAFIAGTQVKPVLTPANCNAASAAKLQLKYLITGTGVVPAGKTRVEYRLL